MKAGRVTELVVRYLILLLAGLFNLTLFYAVFTPLTVYPLYWILSVIDSGTKLLEGNFFYFRGEFLEIIEACVAGAAYYLLLILNMTTPMKLKKRMQSILFLMGSFLVINIIRIGIFAELAVSGSEYFDVAHNIVWYFGSTVIVVAVWFLNVWLFKIKNIPIYSDAKDLFEDVIRKGKKTKKSKSPLSLLRTKVRSLSGLLDARSAPRTEVRGLSSTSTSKKSK